MTNRRIHHSNPNFPCWLKCLIAVNLILTLGVHVQCLIRVIINSIGFAHVSKARPGRVSPVFFGTLCEVTNIPASAIHLSFLIPGVSLSRLQSFSTLQKPDRARKRATPDRILIDLLFSESDQTDCRESFLSYHLFSIVFLVAKIQPSYLGSRVRFENAIFTQVVQGNRGQVPRTVFKHPENGG